MTLISPARLPEQGSAAFPVSRKKMQAYVPLRLFPHNPSARVERVNGLMLSARKGFEASPILKTGYRQTPTLQTGPAFKRALEKAAQTKDWRKAALFNNARKGSLLLRAATEDLSEPLIDQAAQQGSWTRFKLMAAARKESSASWALSEPLPPDYTEKELEAACFEAVRNDHWKFVLKLLGEDLLTNRIVIKLIEYAQRKEIKGVKKQLMNHLLPKDADKTRREDVLLESIEAGGPLTAKYALEMGDLPYDALENAVLACCGNSSCEEKELEAILAYILRKTEGFLFTEARSNALLSAAEQGRTALIHLLLGGDPPERAMRCMEAVYVAKQQKNTFFGAFFNPAEPQHAILNSLIVWSQKKKGTEEYPCRLLAASKILKCEIDRTSELKLSGLRLTSLPDCLHLLEKLETLDLSFNCLTELPPHLQGSATLRTLKLLGNPLEGFPESIASLHPDCAVFAPLSLAARAPRHLLNGSRPSLLYIAEPAKKRSPLQTGELQPPSKASRLS